MFFILLLITCSFLGWAVAGSRKKVLGAVLGLFLGPLGVLISAIACRG